MDLSELLAEAKRRGFTRDFGHDLPHAYRHAPSVPLEEVEARIVETNTADAGTDPGDDATVYLIETTGGERGYMILSDSFHADPRKAAFVDRLRRRQHNGTE
jgi:hypothetical protein